MNFLHLSNWIRCTPRKSTWGKLFNLIIDSVLVELTNNSFGCHINGVFAGIVAYAGELILLSPYLVCLQYMLDLSVDLLIKTGLKKNVDKLVAAIRGINLST